MLFNSYPFLLAFLPLTLLGFFLLGRTSQPLAGMWLVLASLAFYGWWNPRYVALLIGSIAFNYVMGMTIARAKRTENKAQAKRVLATAIACNLLLLGYFKYATFFSENLASLTGIERHLHPIVLPLGISFYTFTQIAFLSDAYRGNTVEFNPLRYALFVTYFPHLIAGPILHHAEMMPQFRRRRVYLFWAENFAVGMTIFAIGLFKKVVLADGIAPFVGPIFGSAKVTSPDFFGAWGAALAYTCQLYFDFSGYSDMAIGLSRLFGIQLPINFNSPYKATSVIEFWRRWHITLSRFLRDYVYVSLGGNRRGRARRYVNLMLTMLLGGLWHGAGWTFVLWGGLHGIYLMINHGWHAVFGSRATPDGRIGRFLGWLLTFLSVVVGWVFFRAPDFGSAIAILRGMLGANGIVLPQALAEHLPYVEPALTRLGISFRLGGGSAFLSMYFWIAVTLAASLFGPNTQEIMCLYRPGLGAGEGTGRAPFLWHPGLGWAIVTSAVGVCGFLSLHHVSEFLYYQF